MPLGVAVKFLKRSSRTAAPRTRRCSPRTSTSPYTAASARLQQPAAIGLDPGDPWEPPSGGAYRTLAITRLAVPAFDRHPGMSSSSVTRLVG